MDFALTEEQEMIVKTTRDFVEAELYPHEAEIEETGVLRPDLRDAIGRDVMVREDQPCPRNERARPARRNAHRREPNVLEPFVIERHAMRFRDGILRHHVERPQPFVSRCDGWNEERREEPKLSHARRCSPLAFHRSKIRGTSRNC